MSFQYPTVIYPFDTVSAELLQHHKSRQCHNNVQPPSYKATPIPVHRASLLARSYNGSDGTVTLEFTDNRYSLTTRDQLKIAVTKRFENCKTQIFETPEHDFYQFYRNGTYHKSDLLVY